MASPSLSCPPPGLEAPLPSFEDPLRRSADAAAGPFTLAGRRALVAGDAGHGVDEVWAGSLRVAERLRVGPSPAGPTAAGNARDAVEGTGGATPAPADSVVACPAVVTPVGVERRLTVGGRAVVERIFVPRDLAAVVVEWRAPDGARLDVSWLACVDGANRADRGSPAGEPAPGGAGAGTGGGSGAGADAETDAGTRGETDTGTRAETGGGSCEAPHYEREGRIVVVRPGRSDGGVAAFLWSGEPVAWRIDAAADSPPRLDCRATIELGPGESVRLAIAAARDGVAGLEATLAALRPATLVRGRAAAVRRLRRERLAADAPDPEYGAAVEWAKCRLDGLDAGAPDPASDRRPGASGARTAARAAVTALGCGEFDVPRELIRAIGDDAPVPDYLRLVARYLAWTGDSRVVREEWPRIERAVDRAAARDPAVGAVPAAVLGELAIAAESVGERGSAQLLRSFERGSRTPPGSKTRPEAAVVAGATATQAGPVGSLEAAAAVIDGLVHGVLGAEPDAPKQRVRLRPRIPIVWDRLDVRRLRLGDAAVALSYRREGDRHLFRLEQEEGAVPLTVVFEPLLPAPRLAAARVDGVEADLDPRPYGDRMLVPVQLVLDAERVVALDVAGDPEPRPSGLRVWQVPA